MSAEISDTERFDMLVSSIRLLEEKLKSANDRNARLVTMNDELRDRATMAEKTIEDMKKLIEIYSKNLFEHERTSI